MLATFASLAQAQTFGTADPTTGTEAEQADVQRARALFEQGLGHVEAARWQKAADSFRAVLEIRRSDVVAYNLASALVQLGQLGEAVDLLTPIARGTAGAEVQEAATQLLAQVEPQVARVSVRVVGESDGLSLRVGEREVAHGWQRRALSVVPGVVTVSLVRDGEIVASQAVSVAADTPALVVTLEVSPKRPATPEPTPSPIAPAAVAAQATPATPDATEPPTRTTRRAEPQDEMLQSWWFWTAGAGAVVGATILVAVLASGQPDAPQYVSGDAGLVVGQVMPPNR